MCLRKPFQRIIAVFIWINISLSGCGSDSTASRVHAKKEQKEVNPALKSSPPSTAYKTNEPPTDPPSDRKEAVQSSPDTDPPEDPFRLIRWQATANVISGSARRVTKKARMEPGVQKMAVMYLELPGVEQSLSETTLDELVTLVRSKKGFNDHINNRCIPGRSVGFRLVRKTPPPSDKFKDKLSIDLVVDFGCNRMHLAETGAATLLQSTYFGDLRNRFIALVQHAIPDDPKLKELR